MIGKNFFISFFILENILRQKNDSLNFLPFLLTIQKWIILHLCYHLLFTVLPLSLYLHFRYISFTLSIFTYTIICFNKKKKATLHFSMLLFSLSGKWWIIDNCIFPYFFILRKRTMNFTNFQKLKIQIFAKNNFFQSFFW